MNEPSSGPPSSRSAGSSGPRAHSIAEASGRRRSTSTVRIGADSNPGQGRCHGWPTVWRVAYRCRIVLMPVPHTRRADARAHREGLGVGTGDVHEEPARTRRGHSGQRDRLVRVVAAIGHAHLMAGRRCIGVRTEPGQLRVVLLELGRSRLSKAVQLAVLLLGGNQCGLEVSLSHPVGRARRRGSRERWSQ